MRLSQPPIPFQKLDVVGESITIDVSAKKIVIPTDNQLLLPGHNQWTESPNICDLVETPCGGLKNSIVQDKSPGALSIEGEGCYLQNVDGTYTGKTIGAGKLSETSSIKDSGTTGIALATADGLKVKMMDGNFILLRPPSCIIEEFKVINFSNVATTYTITVQCPDSVDSIELYNLNDLKIEPVEFTLADTSYTYSMSIAGNSSIKLRITVKYQSLEHTTEFSNNVDQNIGLQNMSKSFIAIIPKTGTEIDILNFTERPKSLSYKQEPDGAISQITIVPGNGSINHSRITYPDHSKVSGIGTIPDCLNKDIEGSVAKFLQPYGMKNDSPVNATITTWVVPAISDEKILPLSSISEDRLGDTITIRASPGESTCASFVINSDTDISNLQIVVSDFINGDNLIPNEAIVVKYVKCWYQNGYDSYGLDRTGNYYTPELLLNDDTMIYVIDDPVAWNVSSPIGTNYLKLKSGNYMCISSKSRTVASGMSVIPISDMDCSDSKTLQPLNLPHEYNKQIWLSVHIPQDSPSGSYNGTICINSNRYTLKSIHLSIQVLPITLLQPSMEYGIFYRALPTESGSISSESKTIEQFTAEMLDLVAHGVTNPTIYGPVDNTTLDQILSIRQGCGLDNTNIYYLGISVLDITSEKISSMSNVLSKYNVQQLYVYGYDESEMDTPAIRSQIDAAHALGIKVLCGEATESYLLNIADVLDLCVIGLPPSTSYSTLYHSYTSFDGEPHKVYMYGQPQTVPEYPHFFRLNYGLLLWQMGYDGALDYAYQHSMGNIWDDFDSSEYRDHVFAYPTSDGVIDTIQFEGYREASNDIRYLTTLQAAIISAKDRGVSTTEIESWVATLKTTDLTSVNLDVIRSQIIDSILELQ